MLSTVNCIRTDESQTCTPETNNTVHVNKKVKIKNKKFFKTSVRLVPPTLLCTAPSCLGKEERESEKHRPRTGKRRLTALSGAGFTITRCFLKRTGHSLGIKDFAPAGWATSISH